MGEYDFLPPGLELANVERETKWVQAGMQPDGVPPLEIEIAYFGAADVREAATAGFASMPQRDFLKKAVTGWRNATLKNIRAVYKPAGKLMLRAKADAPESASTKPVDFNMRFFLEVYSGSYLNALYNPIFGELMAWSDDDDQVVRGKGDSSET